MHAPVRTTAPSGAVVSVAEAVEHCRADGTDDAVLIGTFIDAAIAHLDGYVGVLGGICLLDQQWTQVFDKIEQELRLPLRPVSAIVSITVTDSAGVESVIASENYALLCDASGWYVRFVDAYALPGDLAEVAGVAIVFAVGYGEANDVPPAIRLAIKMLVAHWYNNREAVNVGSIINEFPLGVSALLAPYRRYIY